IVADSDGHICFYSSSDGGRTWTSGPTVEDGAFPPAEEMPFSLDEDGVVWAVKATNINHISKTSNLGGTWTEVYGVVNPSDSPFSTELDAVWAAQDHQTWQESV